MTAWTCDLHQTRNAGDCPKCDDEMVELTEPDAGDVEALARVVRDAVKVRPLGPNSRSVHESGGSVALTSTEADEAALAVLSAGYRPAAEVRRDTAERTLREVLAAIQNARGRGFTLEYAEVWLEDRIAREEASRG